MHPLAARVSHFISKNHMLAPGDRLGLAVSGGADSVAMLRLLLDLRQHLGIVPVVLHFNHRLRAADSEADEVFVKELSRKHGLDFFRAQGDVTAHAAEKHLTMEAAARALRYEFFTSVSASARLNRVATAHTLDDQAETVLLKLARGAGTRGLSGIYPKLALPNRYPHPDNPKSENPQPDNREIRNPELFIIRPLISIRRRDIEAFLSDVGQPWREDRSNRDLRYARNVVRHGILPRFERNLNPSIRETLADTAEVARAEEEYWNTIVGDIMPSMLKSHDSHIDAAAALDAKILTSHPLAVQRRLLRAVAEGLPINLDFKHTEDILGLASKTGARESSMLSGGWRVARRGGEIIFCPPASPRGNYRYKLPVPGRIAIPEARTTIEAMLIRPGAKSAYNSDEAIDPALLSGELEVRNWRPGDRFWPAHRKSPKKIKELLQERHLNGDIRARTPVVVSGNEVIWLQGFPPPAALRPRRPGEACIFICAGEIAAVV